MTARRELQLAVLLCLLGSALVLLAVSRTWGVVLDDQRLTIDTFRTAVSGRQVAPGAMALGYVGLAGVVALAATRRTGRVVVGVLLALAGALVVGTLVDVLSSGLATEIATAVRPCTRACGTGNLATTRPGWVWLAMAGGLLQLAAGLLVTLRGRRWAALSSSYEPPARVAPAPPATDKAAPVSDKAVWDALDRGDDPTA